MPNSMTELELYEKARDLRAGDVVLLQRLSKQDHEGRVHPERVLDTYSMRVSSVSVDEEQVGLTLVPCGREDTMRCGFSVMFVGKKPNSNHTTGKFGLQNLEVIGREKNWAESWVETHW